MPYVVLAVGTLFVLAAMPSVYPPGPGASVVTWPDGQNPDNPPQPPEDNNSGSRSTYEIPIQDCNGSAVFGSMSDLERYFNVTGNNSPPLRRYYGGWYFAGVPSPALGGARMGLTAGGSDNDHSETNVQVAGIDEEDIVKTDGEYLYAVSGKDVAILKAYPANEAVLLSKITLASTPYGIFIDDDRLVIIVGSYDRDYRNQEVEVLLYDVTDPAVPSLIRNLSVSGSFVGARLYEGYAYVVTSYYPFTYDYPGGYKLQMPFVRDGTRTMTMDPSKIVYFTNQSEGADMVMILALKTTGDEEPTLAGYLIGGIQTLYVSTEHIFVAGLVYRQVWRENESFILERTAIHKVVFEGSYNHYQCSGEVPGGLINQFAMDEYRTYLRVVTTGGHVTKSGGDAKSNVYTLSYEMKPVGELEGLAPGEQLHSVRFVGDRAYLVTFKKIDPFFVVDLSDPASPRVLGYLKIPGFSEYLHPLDANHVIGIGKDTVEGEGGGFAWYQGVKLSLFDVTDVEHPSEISKYVIGDRGTDSEILRDHKALMFDAERGLLALPVSVAQINKTMYPFGAPPNTYGEFVWQGVYVFSVSVEHGFILQGRVTHGATGPYYYSGDPDTKSLVVRRALYIEDVLYTVSDALVKMNNLVDFGEIGRIPL